MQPQDTPRLDPAPLRSRLGSADRICDLRPVARTRRGRPAGRTLALVLLALGLPVACDQGPAPEPLTYARVAHDLLLDPPRLEVLESNPEAPLSIGTLTPSGNYRRDGAELRSLVLPPPSTVSFQVGACDGLRLLRLRAGVDRSAARFLRRKAPQGAFTFEVLLNGVSVSSVERGLASAEPEGSVETEWADLPDADRLTVVQGDVVTLRTGVRDALGAPVPAPIGPRIGFGGLRLEELVTRPRAIATPEAPNLIVVVVDTLRRDRLSAYGYERATTPVLDELAARGTVFENAYSTASWTWPATASLLTGLRVREHGVENSATSFLAPELTTLAEVGQAAGLTTAGWSGNPLISPRLNFGQGFESLTTSTRGMLDTGEFFGEVQAWLAANADRRFLLYLHLVEPHHPLVPLPRGRELFAADVDDTGGRLSAEAHPAFTANTAQDGARLPLDELLGAADRQGVSDLYDACVWSADHWLGRVLEQLEQLGLDDRTLVAFTSDHGEELFERGHLGHGRTLYEELVGVPLVLAGPGVPAGRRLEAPVSNRLLPTYLAARLGSSALGPDRLFADDPARTVLFSTRVGVWGEERQVELLGLRSGARSVHYAVGPVDDEGRPAFDPERLQVFDLANDPHQRLDRTPRDPAEARSVWSALRGRFDALQRVRGQRVEGASSATLELLESLGYIGR